MGNFRLHKKLVFLGAVLTAALFYALPAEATGGGGGAACTNGGLGEIICNTTKSSQDVPGLLTGLSYLFGLVMGVWAISKLYEHVQNPQQTPIWDSLKRFLAGGAFFALPMVMDAAKNTITAGTAATGSMNGFTGKTSGAGLDAMMVMLVKDIWQPLLSNALPAFTYLAGIILIMIGINRLIKSSQEGPRGPGGFGTIMTFIAAGAMFSMDTLLDSFSTSMFTTDVITTKAQLQYTTGMSGPEQAHVHAVISAIIAFMAILGWISFIRGWFIIRDVAEGNQQASLMSAITHLLGGALAINLGPLLNSVQATLGLTAYGVNFS